MGFEPSPSCVGAQRIGRVPGQVKEARAPVRSIGRSDRILVMSTHRIIAIAAAISAAASLSVAADRSERPAAAPRGTEALLRLDLLPLVRDGDAARHVSSYDRTGGNNDGFEGTWSALSERNGEHVIVEAGARAASTPCGSPVPKAGGARSPGAA